MPSRSTGRRTPCVPSAPSWRYWAGALLLLSSLVQAQGVDPRVTGYRVTLTLPSSGDTITASARVALVRTPNDQTLVLDLVGLAVDGVHWARDTGSAMPEPDAWAPASFAYDGRVLRVSLPSVRGAVESDVVEVRYHGAPRDGLLIGVDVHGRRAVFADNWPERARYWLPSADRPAAKATVAFDVRAPAGWRVVANGAPQPAGTGGAAWLESRPVPPYTMVIGAARFTVSQHRPAVLGRDTVPVEVWAYPEDSEFADSGPFRQATEIVEVLERLVGPFPYEKLAHVESATRFGGMENASAIFYDEGAWSERRMTEAVVRHETAHQWFGDAVTERDWHDLWLSEGFATYFDLVVGAALHGDSLLATGLRADADRYFRSPVVGRPIVDTAEHDPLRLLNANNYEKGAWVLAMLRATVGDSAFWSGIRAYYRAFRDSTAVSRDLQTVMERAAGRPLGWFFDQWLDQPGYPKLRCRWQATRDSTSSRASLVLEEVQPASWGVFRLPDLSLDFVGPGGVRARRRMPVLSPDVRASFDLPFVPTALELDPDHELLLTSESNGP
ncbi:MAG TPA: M1 family metallopeptidase [Gemmatimonadales bacterium]|nr:M1 family metallopeptidase [Gemmatimonadales bacterium]